jgi:hypothetical protein
VPFNGQPWLHPLPSLQWLPLKIIDSRA